MGIQRSHPSQDKTTMSSNEGMTGIFRHREVLLILPSSGKDSDAAHILKTLGYGDVPGQQPGSIQSLTCRTDARMLVLTRFQGRTAQ